MRLSSQCVCTPVFKWVQVCVPRAAEISHLSWWEWSRPCFSISFPFKEAVGFPQGRSCTERICVAGMAGLTVQNDV